MIVVLSFEQQFHHFILNHHFFCTSRRIRQLYRLLLMVNYSEKVAPAVILTYTVVRIPAGEFYCTVVFSLWILFVFFVFPFRIKPINKAIVQQIYLQKLILVRVFQRKDLLWCQLQLVLCNSSFLQHYYIFFLYILQSYIKFEKFLSLKVTPFWPVFIHVHCKVKFSQA